MLYLCHSTPPHEEKIMKIVTPDLQEVSTTILYGPVVEHNRFKLIVHFESATFHGRKVSFDVRPLPFYRSNPDVQKIQQKFKDAGHEFGWMFIQAIEDDLLYVNLYLETELTEEMGQHLIDELPPLVVLPT